MRPSACPIANVGLTPYTMPNLLCYLHACAGYPVASTWLQAIHSGYFLTWPGLSPARVQKYLPKSDETFFGHLKLIRQGVRSTRNPLPLLPEDYSPKDTCTTSKGANQPITSKGYEYTAPERRTSTTHGLQRPVMVCSVPVNDIASTRELNGIFGTDQTGRFPVTSTQGYKYILILFNHDADLVHYLPIKSQKANKLVRAFKESYYDELTRCGFQPILHRIDNETSSELVTTIQNCPIR